MSGRTQQQRELVYCHACENEWSRDEHGLECPECHSDVVEIIDESHDPRDNHITISDDDDDDNASTRNNAPDSLPRHPLHNHNPWEAEPPDPDEPDIEHVEWHPAPGVRIAHTSYRSSTPGRHTNDPIGSMFQAFSSAAYPNSITQQQRAQRPFPPHMQHSNSFGPPQFQRPNGTPQNNFLDDQHHHHMHGHVVGMRDPGGAGGGRHTFTATLPSTGGPAAFPGNGNGNPLQAVLSTLLQSMQTGMVEQGNGPAGPHPGAGIHAFITSMLGNGQHGDAVYTDEALDRIITQMMDQTNANSAPGPASAAAIAALPKQKVDKTFMGQDGKAECSVCMDGVDIGDEVTMLPCKHWFHGDCVGAWLKEHDTCPHCRQGIMPKDAPEDASTPRSPDQAPRNFQNPFVGMQPPTPTAPPDPSTFTRPRWAPPPNLQHPYIPGGYPTYPEPRDYVVPQGPHPQPPYSQPPSPQSQHPPPPSETRRPRSASTREGSSRSNNRSDRGAGNGNGSGGQGVTGWIRNRLGGSDHR